METFTQISKLELLGHLKFSLTMMKNNDKKMFKYLFHEEIKF